MLGKDNTPKPGVLAPIKPKAQVAQQWSVPIGSAQKTSAYLKIKPVMVGGVLYTADVSGLVQAIKPETGAVLWSKKLDQKLVSGPTVAKGFIAVTSNDSDVILLKQSDGSQVWKTKLSGDVLSQPLIVNQQLMAKTVDGKLYALDLNKGEKLWVSDHGAPGLVLKASSSPVLLNNDVVLVGYSDGRMDAVDLKTGHVVWQRSIAYASGSSDVERLVDIDADPITRGMTVFLASYQGYVGALSLTTGEFIWRKPASTYKNIVLNNDTVYMTDSNDVIWAMNASNGQVLWKQVDLKARGLTEPTIMGSNLVVGDRTGFIHVLSRQSGEIVARQSLGAPVDIAPSVQNNTMFVATANGRLTRLSLS